MDQVLADFIDTGPDPAHLARIKRQIRAEVIFALDDQAGQARRYGEALTSGLTVADVAAWPGALDAVSAEDVIRVAKMVFDRRKSVTGWLMGEGDAQ